MTVLVRQLEVRDDCGIRDKLHARVLHRLAGRNGRGTGQQPGQNDFPQSDHWAVMVLRGVVRLSYPAASRAVTT